MARFSEAFKTSSARLGGYRDDPTGRGGETYRGIARERHPEWRGWRRVDAARRRRGFPNRLDSDRVLQEEVRDFYRQTVWDRIGGDRLSDQKLARELYETAVNMGVRRAVRFLQSSLNLLDRDRRDRAELVVDGWLGDRTHAALVGRLKRDRGSRTLIGMLQMQQGVRYLQIMAGDADRERLLRAWIERG